MFHYLMIVTLVSGIASAEEGTDAPQQSDTPASGAPSSSDTSTSGAPPSPSAPGLGSPDTSKVVGAGELWDSGKIGEAGGNVRRWVWFYEAGVQRIHLVKKMIRLRQMVIVGKDDKEFKMDSLREVQGADDYQWYSYRQMVRYDRLYKRYTALENRQIGGPEKCEFGCEANFRRIYARAGYLQKSSDAAYAYAKGFAPDETDKVAAIEFKDTYGPMTIIGPVEGIYVSGSAATAAAAGESPDLSSSGSLGVTGDWLGANLNFGVSVASLGSIDGEYGSYLLRLTPELSNLHFDATFLPLSWSSVGTIHHGFGLHVDGALTISEWKVDANGVETIVPASMVGSRLAGVYHPIFVQSEDTTVRGMVEFGGAMRVVLSEEEKKVLELLTLESSEHPLFFGVTTRVGVHVNSVKLFSDIYYFPTSGHQYLDQADHVSGLMNWQVLMGAQVQGNLVKVYDGT